jgi:polysaccharide export outer membrane protein
MFLAGILLLPLALAGAAAGQEGYRLKPGDVLRIEVIEDPALNRSALVAPDGTVGLPLAGNVPAAGRTVSEVQADLAARLAANFAAPPNVFVSVERLAEPRVTAAAPAAAAVIDVYVIGEAAKAGRLGVAPGTTVLQLFAEMGGFSKFAATRRIQLRRTDRDGTERIYAINYDAIVAGSSRQGATVLQDGDIIVVPQRRLFE